MYKQRGFTLIELMVVVVIVGILASIALPAYNRSVQKGNRSGAEQLMLQIASQEQQYFLDARSFATALDSNGLNIPSQNGWTCSGTTCTNTYYSVAVTSNSSATPPNFIIKATVCTSCTQTSDGSLYLNTTSTSLAASAYTAGAKYRDAGDNKW